eukprot:scaffold3308_cov154-Isochrysis_galbana.AAC.1
MWHVHVLCCSSCASPGRQGRVRCSSGQKLARGVLRVEAKRARVIMAILGRWSGRGAAEQ